MTYALASIPIASAAIAAPTAAPASVIYQTVTTDIGGIFALSIEITAYTAGSITVMFGGQAAFVALSAVGVYTVQLTADATSTELSISADATFAGSIDNVSCKRLYWLQETIVRDSLQLEGLSNSDTPNSITLNYTVPSSAANWEDATATYTLPDATAGDIALIESSISLPGVFREEEALIKVQARVVRMQNRVRVSWITTDTGIAMQRGTVAQVRIANRGVDILVLVDSVAMVSYGRYRVSGLRYDPLHYPADLPAPTGVGTVPVGAVVMLSGTTVPSGWALYTAANGKYIVVADAADASYEVADTGGAATYAGFSGSTTSGGAHTGTGQTGFETESYTGAIESGSGYRYESDNSSVGGHTHTYSTGTITPNLYRRENILIEKTGTAGAQFPSSAMVFGLAGLILSEISRSTAYQLRYLQAAAASANAGVFTQNYSGTSGSTSDAHDHYSRTSVSNGSPEDIGITDPRYDVGSGGGAHTHAMTLALTISPKRYTVALYSATADFDVIPGMIVMWKGSLSSLPTDWYLCDGANSTPDLRKRMIVIAPVGGEDISVGDNTLQMSGTTNASAGHDHESNYTTAYTYDTVTMKHSNKITHTHDVTTSAVAYTPPYFVLGAIMYNP